MSEYFRLDDSVRDSLDEQLTPEEKERLLLDALRALTAYQCTIIQSSEIDEKTIDELIRERGQTLKQVVKLLTEAREAFVLAYDWLLIKARDEKAHPELAMARKTWKEFKGHAFLDEWKYRDPQGALEDIFAKPSKIALPELVKFIVDAKDHLGDRYCHPFIRDFLQTILPSVLRQLAGEVWNEICTGTAFKGKALSAAVGLGAVVKPETILATLGPLFPRGWRPSIVEKMAEMTAYNPQALEALRTQCPQWYEKNLESVFRYIYTYSEAEAYRVCAEEWNRISTKKHADFADLLLARLPCSSYKSFCSQRQGILGVLRFLSEQRHLLPPNRIVNFYADLNRILSSNHLYTQQVKEFLHELRTIPGHQAFVETMTGDGADKGNDAQPYLVPATQSKNYEWWSKRLGTWDRQDREAVLCVVGRWNADFLQNAVQRYETYQAHEESARKDPDGLAMKTCVFGDHFQPTAALIVDEASLFVLLETPLKMSQEAFRETADAWTAIIFRKWQTQKALWGNNTEELSNSLNFYAPSTIGHSRTQRSQERKEYLFVTYQRLIPFIIRRQLQSKDPSDRRMAMALLPAAIKHCPPAMVLDALRFLPPSEATPFLTPELLHRLENSYSPKNAPAMRSVERTLLDLLYRVPEQPRALGKDRNETIQAAQQTEFSTKLNALFSGGVGTGAFPGKSGPGQLFGPRLLAAAASRGDVRQPIPISLERKRQLTDRAKRLLKENTNEDALSPAWRFQYRTRKALRMVLSRKVLPWAAAAGLLVAAAEEGLRRYVIPPAQRQSASSSNAYNAAMPQEKSAGQNLLHPGTLLPHAPTIEEQKESDKYSLYLSEKLEGDNQYLVTGFYGPEDPSFKRDLVAEEHTRAFLSGLVLGAWKRVHDMSAEERRELTVVIPNLHRDDTIPLPLEALPRRPEHTKKSVSSEDKVSGGAAFSTRPDLGGLTVSAADYNSASVAFSLPRDGRVPDHSISIEELRTKIPDSILTSSAPKLAPEILKTLAPSLAQAVEEAKKMSAFDAAVHLEAAVRKFIKYEPRKEYEEGLDSGYSPNPEGRHKYLEMILSLQEGECAQAMELLQELHAHVGIFSVPVSCFRADGQIVPLIPHGALVSPMIDKSGALFPAIFDGTPENSRESLLQTPQSDGTETKETPSSWYTHQAKILTLLAAFAIASGGGIVARQWHKKRQGQQEKMAERGKDERPPELKSDNKQTLPPTNISSLIALVKAVALNIVAVVAPKRVKKYPPLSEVLPSCHRAQLLSFLEAQCGPLPQSLIVDGDLGKIADSTEAEEFLRRVALARATLEKSLQQFAPVASELVGPLAINSQQQVGRLTELVVFWIQRSLQERHFFQNWSTTIQKVDLDEAQHGFLLRLFQILRQKISEPTGPVWSGELRETLNTLEQDLRTNGNSVPQSSDRFVALLELIQGFPFAEKG